MSIFLEEFYLNQLNNKDDLDNDLDNLDDLAISCFGDREDIFKYPLLDEEDLLHVRCVYTGSRYLYRSTPIASELPCRDISAPSRAVEKEETAREIAHSEPIEECIWGQNCKITDCQKRHPPREFEPGIKKGEHTKRKIKAKDRDRLRRNALRWIADAQGVPLYR